MSFFKNMRLTKQISFVIALTMILGIGTTLATLKGMQDVGEMLASMHAGPVHHQLELKTIADNYAVAIVDAAHKARDGALSFSEARAGIEAASSDSARRWRSYRDAPNTAEELELGEEANRIFEKADAAASELDRLLANEDRSGVARFAADQMYPAIDPLTEVQIGRAHV